MSDQLNEKNLHEERVAAALSIMPADQNLADIAAIFKAMGEPSRLKILFALSAGELCVDHIVSAVGGNQSAVSHQLKVLKDNRILRARRDGKNVLYSIADGHIMTIIQMAKEHIDCE